MFKVHRMLLRVQDRRPRYPLLQGHLSWEIIVYIKVIGCTDVTEPEKIRIATILEINSHLIKICLSLQSTVPAENIPTDPTYSGCLYSFYVV